MHVDSCAFLCCNIMLIYLHFSGLLHWQCMGTAAEFVEYNTWKRPKASVNIFISANTVYVWITEWSQLSAEEN